MITVTVSYRYDLLFPYTGDPDLLLPPPPHPDTKISSRVVKAMHVEMMFD